jgi:molybdopterin converting factor small subunit
MPLRPELKEFIEKTEGMTDAYRKQLLKTMENAPDALQAGWLRQADYDRTMNEGKEELKTQGEELKAKEDALEQKTGEWNKWKGDADKIVSENVTRADGLQKSLAERDEKIVELQDKIRAGDFSEGSEGEMLKEVTILRNEIKDLRTAAANGEGRFTKDQAEKMLLEGGNRLAGNIYDNIFLLMDLNQSHNEEFKEGLNREEFIKFATDRRMLGTQEEFRTAYDLYVQDKRVEAKIETARADERQKIESKIQFPLDNDGGQSIGKGPVETRLGQMNREAEGLDSKLTTKQAAAAAAAELRKEGKVAPE